MGSVVLRVIMDKFNKIDDSKNQTFWGNAHPSLGSRKNDPRLELQREMIISCSMPHATAKGIIQNIQPDRPW